MLYLNGPESGDFEGGNTNFFDPKSNIKARTVIKSVTPKQGMAIVFYQGPEHALFHEGAKLTQGHKYILRANIFYTNEIAE